MRCSLVCFTMAVVALTCGFTVSTARSDVETICTVGAANTNDKQARGCANCDVRNFHIPLLNANTTGTKSSSDWIDLSEPIVTRDVTSSQMPTIPIPHVGFSPSQVELPAIFSDSYRVAFVYGSSLSYLKPISCVDPDDTQFSQFDSAATLSILWPP